MTTIGTRYGQRTVIGEAPPGRRGCARLFVRCDCGTESTVEVNDLKRGEADSCRACMQTGFRRRHTINRKLRLLPLYDTSDLDPIPGDRRDCRDAPRPCSVLRCRFHLALDVTPIGSVVVDAELDLAAMPYTCALDVADRGPSGLVEIGERMGLTRERARQIAEGAMRKLAADPEAARVWRDWLEWRAGLPHDEALDEGADHGDIRDLRDALDRFIARKAQEAAE